MKQPEKYFCDECNSEILDSARSSSFGWKIYETTPLGMKEGNFCDRKCLIDFYSKNSSVKAKRG